MEAMFDWLHRLFGPPPASRSPARGRPAAPAAASRPRPAAPAPTERTRLLREAGEIHRAKRKILDALSDEDRAKLVSMAILTLLEQKEAPPPARPAPRPSPPVPSPRRK